MREGSILLETESDLISGGIILSISFTAMQLIIPIVHEETVVGRQ